MPIYGYECKVCHHRFEVSQKVTDKPIQKCEKCGSPVKKLIFPVGVVFKGSGFYVTDNPKKSSGSGDKKSYAMPSKSAVGSGK